MKIAMSYLKLEDKTRGREALNRLIEKYPDSAYIARARELLRGL